MKIKYLFLIPVLSFYYFSFAQTSEQTVHYIFRKWEKKLEITPENVRINLKEIIPETIPAADSLSTLKKYYSAKRFELKLEDKFYLNELRWNLATQLRDTLELIKVLHDMSGILINLSAFDDAYKLSFNSLEKARKIHHDTLQLYAINFMSGIFVRQYKNDSVLRLIDSAEQAFGNIKHKIWTALYANRGIAYEQKGDYKKAINAYLKSYEVARNFKDIRAQIIGQFNIGYLYNSLNQFDKSKEYLQKSLSLSAKHKIKDYEAYSTEQLALAYGGMDSLKLSLQYYQSALKLFENLGNRPYVALTYKNIASTYLNLDNKEKALAYARKAVRLAKGIKPDLIWIGAQQTLALALIENKKYTEAEQLLNRNLALKNQMDLPTLIDLYTGLYQIALSKKDYKSALNYYKKSDALLDSVAYNNKMKMVREIETKYQAEKKEKENQRLLAEQYKQEAIIQQKTKQNILLAGGFGAALAVAGVFGFFYNRNRRQKRLIESLQKDLHHRVKNNLGIISSLVEEIKNEFDTPELGARLNDLHTRIMSIHKIHEQLYKEKNVYALGLKEYLEKLVENVRKTYGRDDVKIDIDVDGKIKVNPLKSFPLGLIVAEFLSNSFKHAFKDSRHPGHIAIKVEQKGGQYVLKLKDNGSGPEQAVDLERAGSYGIRIMRGMARQMKAHLKLYYNQGMNMELAFG